MCEERYRTSIREWPEEERPRERLIQYGAEGLSDAQVLAIILRSGDSAAKMSAIDLARALLTEFDGFRGLDAASISELCATKGIGPAKAAQVKASLEIGRRLMAGTGARQVAFRTSSDVTSFYIPMMRGLKKEVFKCVLLDARNRIQREVTVSEGSLTGSIVHPREVFSPAIRDSAAAVLFVHNHPSGDPTPSQEDIQITKQLVEAGKILGIRVLDHVIVGEERSMSFADEGLL